MLLDALAVDHGPPELLRRDFKADMVTDQTSAHDELNGYVPNGFTLEEAEAQKAQLERQIQQEKARKQELEARKAELMAQIEELGG